MKKSSVYLLYTDRQSQIHTDPELLAVGVNGRQLEIADEDWVDLPVGGELMILPGRLPMGYNPKTREAEVVDAHNGPKGMEPATAVAAILPVGYTRTLLPGFETAKKQQLPLFGYTAVGATRDGQIKVAALKTDEDLKWNPVYYHTRELPRLIKRKQKAFPDNRILTQLAKCALDYHCLTAQNIFYERWEAGIPVSTACNADCIGCISRQPAECCPSPQSRIKFTPTPAEIVPLAVHHLDHAGDAIISFGQGCEGEPLLAGDTLVSSVREIRKQTGRGTINMNSNAGKAQTLDRLIAAGLDSIRVSIFSARPEHYQWYHRPRDYGFSDVEESVKLAAAQKINVAVNYLFFPGFSNQPEETGALIDFLARTGVQQIQLRNLNLDPAAIGDKLRVKEEVPTISEWLEKLRQNLPDLSIGNYTRPKRH